MLTTLYTRDNQPVIQVDVPPFDPPPEVIIYGTRCFVRETFTRYTMKPRYIEGLAWHPIIAAPAVPVDPPDPLANMDHEVDWTRLLAGNVANLFIRPHYPDNLPEADYYTVSWPDRPMRYVSFGHALASIIRKARAK